MAKDPRIPGAHVKGFTYLDSPFRVTLVTKGEVIVNGRPVKTKSEPDVKFYREIGGLTNP